MPEELENYNAKRLVPAKPLPPAYTNAGIFKPAANGQVVNIPIGPLAVDPTTKKLIPLVSGANDSTGIVVGFNEWPITVNDKGRVFLGIWPVGSLGHSMIATGLTSPYFISGVFDRRDLDTAITDADLALGGWRVREDGFITKAS